ERAFAGSRSMTALKRAYLKELQRIDALGPERHAEALWRFKSAEEFKIFSRRLEVGLQESALSDVSQELSLLAESCLAQVAAWQSGQWLENRTGTRRSPACGWAIFALGKLGGEELTVHSDLDLVVFYDGDPADSRLFTQALSFVEKILGFFEQS